LLTRFHLAPGDCLRPHQAEGSGFGFGAIGSGAKSSDTLLGAGAGAAAGAPPPQPGAQLGATPQQVGWHLVLQHFSWQENKVSRMQTTALRTGVRGQRQVCPQAAFSQQATGFAQQAGLAQAFSQQAGAQAGLAQAFSQHAGAQAGFGQQTLHFGWRHGFLWQQILPQAAFSQHAGFGQAFSQTAGAGQQTAGFAQAFSQTAGAGQQPFPTPQAGFSQQHFALPHLRQANMSFSPWNRSHRLQRGSHAGLQQAGSGAQHLAAAGLQQAGAAQAWHVPQPPQFSPAARPKRSIPNPWLARATLTRSAPKTNLPFIERTLLFNELG
jgi:hypothetical protein